MADIRIDGIAKSFGRTRALEDITLEVADGEFVALLGPSGCGKTTLLRIIAGLETASAGRVVIGGRDVTEVPARRRGLAMVFQNYAVFPHMTVYENIAFGLHTKRAKKDVIKERVQRAADLLHIAPYLNRYPGKLSGGQRQRVAVARALAVEPPVLLMDEPLSNLDALLRLEMRAELKAVLRDAGTTTIYVTHDQTEAMGLADRIALMHDGRIEQVDTPTAIYRKPKSRFVGGFVGSPPMNFITVPVERGQARLGPLLFPAPVADAIVQAGMRAEDFTITEPDKGIAFVVAVAEPLGAHTLLTGHFGRQMMRVTVPPDRDIKVGARIGLVPHADRLVWIEPETGKALQPAPVEAPPAEQTA